MSFKIRRNVLPAVLFESTPQSFPRCSAASAVVARAVRAQMCPYPAHRVWRVVQETRSSECHDSMMLATRPGSLVGDVGMVDIV